jgi:hypothetical protein
MWERVANLIDPNERSRRLSVPRGTGITWHTFRRTFASRLTREGADLVTVKELLGHSSISVTMRHAHTSQDAKVRAVRLLERSCAKSVTVAAPSRKWQCDSLCKLLGNQVD